MGLPAINQRDLRLRSKEIMDSVENGSAYELTRDGRPIATITPIRRKSTFVSREQLIETFRGAPAVSPERFFADIDEVIDPYYHDPFERNNQ